MSENKKLVTTIVSASPKKNIKQVVYINVGPDGKKDSITRHEPLDSSAPVYRRKFGKNNQQ
jgi:hypothetical protein